MKRVILMPDEFYVQQVQELQSQFLKRLEFQANAEIKPVPSLLNQILSYDDDVVELSLGQGGKRLKSFAQEIDFHHPGLGLILDGALSDDGEFSKECLEILMLTKFAKEHQLNKILPSIKNILQGSSSKDIFKRIDRPTFNRLHVRLLKNPEDRQLVRHTKQAQVIELRTLYRKGEDAWIIQPSNFRMFLRFDRAYQDEIDKAEKKAARFYSLGCVGLGDEIQKTVDEFRTQVAEAYYGFNRITMSNAALIVAKSLGFELAPGIGAGGRHIQVSRGFFNGYNFDPKWLDEEYACFTPFIYEPRVYPLHELLDIAPENVKNTIAHLDAFPEADKKPIFDHFCVIVPSVRFPHETTQAVAPFRILDEKKNQLEFDTREEAQRALDRILIQGGYFHPIIIGEKDSRCFFISYFA